MSSMLRSATRFGAVAIATVALGAAAAQAGNGLSFSLSVDGGPPFIFNPTGVDVGGGVFNYADTLFDIGYSFGWDISAKADPFINGGLVFVNTGAATVSFDLIITLPVNPAVLPSSLMGGSVAGGLTTDGDGGTLSSFGGDPVWAALIDGNQVQTLLNDPFAVSLPGFGSIGILPEAFGMPIPSMAGPAVNDTIGIRLRFTLSSGDQASFSTVFIVEAIPAPAGLAVLGMFGVFGGRRRRA